MVFRRLRSQRRQSGKSATSPWLLVLYGCLSALAGCATIAPTTLPESARPSFDDYQTKPDFKAFAVGFQSGQYGRSWNYRRPKWAMDRAMQECGKRGSACQLYAVGNTVVFGMSAEQIANIQEKYYYKVIAAPRIDERGKILSSEEIEKYLSGRTLEGITNQGERVTLTLFADGSMTARSNTGIEDTGTWYAKDGKFCRQFRRFTNGILDCQQIVKDGDTFRFYSEGKYVSEGTIKQ